MYVMVFSHLSYCVTVWSQGSQLTMKPVRSLYKQTLKMPVKKPNRWHHCNILQKHSLFLSTFLLICLSFNCFLNV